MMVLDELARGTLAGPYRGIGELISTTAPMPKRR
jgi:hypothetical protein